MAKVYELRSIRVRIQVVEVTVESAPLIIGWSNGKIVQVGQTLEITTDDGTVDVAEVGDWVAKDDDGFWKADIGTLITDYQSLGVREIIE